MFDQIIFSYFIKLHFKPILTMNTMYWWWNFITQLNLKVILQYPRTQLDDGFLKKPYNYTTYLKTNPLCFIPKWKININYKHHDHCQVLIKCLNMCFYVIQSLEYREPIILITSKRYMTRHPFTFGFIHRNLVFGIRWKLLFFLSPPF